MAFTRKFLKDLGIEAEAIDKIIDEHRGTVDGLKDEVDSLKTEIDSKKEAEKELSKLKEEIQASDAYKDKYDKLKKDFENYKSEIAGERTAAKKTDLFRAELKKAGVSEKRIESVLRLAKADGLIDKIEFDDSGIKDADLVSKSITEAYSDYIEVQQKSGADVPQPPANTPNTFNEMTLADKMSYANSHPDAPEVASWLKGE